MDKIGVIYWSGTGNTQGMANAIAKGAGEIAALSSVEEINPEEAAGFDGLMLGCPAMGAEVLEEDAFEPFFTALEGKLSGKPVALFGSYGWGDGEWMRAWQERVLAAGAGLFEEGLIVNEAPDDAALRLCEDFGARFARQA